MDQANDDRMSLPVASRAAAQAAMAGAHDAADVMTNGTVASVGLLKAALSAVFSHMAPILAWLTGRHDHATGTTTKQDALENDRGVTALISVETLLVVALLPALVLLVAMCWPRLPQRSVPTAPVAPVIEADAPRRNRDGTATPLTTRTPVDAGTVWREWLVWVCTLRGHR